ncbi:GNAT family N-acetyltransferase [Komagataeibacter xylinus]|uniref:GNAT family N-acetyltransferase n=1 Tax=Komagataeibacter xylinus TaxID=28448 RepID=A0A857FRH3_KOMXY|nr:GNAT family N-acetyltransferase [Komagataeibacter xylinus]QHC36802.1 GNAT family N-acetyltransferase [Komagataeibacter xylinus]
MTDSALLTRIETRPMHEADLEAGYALSKALSWPHRLEDWQFMFSVGEGRVAVTDTGAIIGTIMWWRYGAGHASLGMVIVADAWQGHGIGKRLMIEARNALPGVVIHLNATPTGVPLYEKMGFRPCGIVEQRQSNAAAQPLIALPGGVRLRPAGQNDLEAIVACDTQACGMDRRQLVTALLATARGVIVDQEGEIAGYAFCRKFGWGMVVGPVMATSTDYAAAMIAYWIGSHAGQFMRLDIAQDCGLSRWLDEIGLLRVDAVAAMSTDGSYGNAGASPMQRFALCSQAFG